MTTLTATTRPRSQLGGRDAAHGDGAPARTSRTSGCRRRNCHELLFDDVIWVRRARQEFDAFVDLMRERGVEVLLLHDLLAETLEDAEAREWLLSRRLRPEEVTAMFSDELHDWMSEMPADELATRLTGGVTVLELAIGGLRLYWFGFVLLCWAPASTCSCRPARAPASLWPISCPP